MYSYNPYYEQYLAHHGVKGMRWGVRKERKAIKKFVKKNRKTLNTERVDLIDKYYSKSNYRKKSEQLKRQAEALYNKYNFNGDDGGGGKTKADREAGRKYMELYNKAELVQEQGEGKAFDKAARTMINKYGEATIKELNNRNKKVLIGGGAAFLASVFAAPLAVAYMTH